MKITIRSNAQKVARLLREVIPKIQSQEMNRAIESYAKDFARHMVREVFSVPGRYNIKRRTTAKGPPAPGSQPTAKVQIAKKMRVAGFRATLSGRSRLDRKHLEFSTKNPALIAREEGDVAEPELTGRKRRLRGVADDGFLYARKLTPGRRKKWKKPYGPRRARSARVQEEYDKLLREGITPRKIQQARIPAVLRLRLRWRAYRSRGQRYFVQMTKRITQRSERASGQIRNVGSRGTGGTSAAA